MELDTNIETANFDLTTDKWEIAKYHNSTLDILTAFVGLFLLTFVCLCIPTLYSDQYGQWYITTHD